MSLRNIGPVVLIGAGKMGLALARGWLTAGLAPIRHLRPVRSLSRRYPEAEVRSMDAKWYRLASYDSAIVSMNDGTSAALYQRDPQKYRELLKETLALHETLRREWPRLTAERLVAELTQTLLAAERARFHTLTLAEQRMLAELLHKLALAR